MSGPRLAFVVGGAQKSGTTTLDAILRRHPSIQMATAKETHVFDDEARDWSDPRTTDLDPFFEVADHRLRGECTPITLYWRPAVRRLAAYNPDMKIVLVLRDPIARAYANWCKEYAAGLEQLPFAQAIRDGRRRVVDQAETEGLHRTFSYVERGFYGQQLEQLYRSFPRSNVHCEIFEEFVAAPGAALDRITAFLGVERFENPMVLPHLHPRRAIAYPSDLSPQDVDHLASLYAEDVAKTEGLLRRSLGHWLPMARS